MNAAQKQLVEDYMPFAQSLAKKQKRILPEHIDLDDLISASYVGLVEAALRYDTNSVVPFATYSANRIRGSICDYLRSLGAGSRAQVSYVTNVRAEQRNTEEYEDFFGSIPCKQETDVDEWLDHVCSPLSDKRAKEILRLYFFEDYSLKDVASKFGVSDGRISQIISECKTMIGEIWTENRLRCELAA